MRDHGGVDPNAITTEGWLTQWLDERVSDRAIGRPAAYNYAKIIKNHLVPAIGSVRLQDLQGANIRKLKSELLQSRRPGTVRKILGLLRQALNSAVTQKLIASNPASDVPMPSQKHGKKERRALSESEIAKLLRVAKNTPYDMVIGFALATGARQAEVLGAGHPADERRADGSAGGAPHRDPRAVRAAVLQSAVRHRDRVQDHSQQHPGDQAGRPWVFSVTPTTTTPTISFGGGGGFGGPPPGPLPSSSGLSRWHEGRSPPQGGYSPPETAASMGQERLGRALTR